MDSQSEVAERNKLIELLERVPPAALLRIPGVFEILSEYFRQELQKELCSECDESGVSLKI